MQYTSLLCHRHIIFLGAGVNHLFSVGREIYLPYTLKYPH